MSAARRLKVFNPSPEAPPKEQKPKPYKFKDSHKPVILALSKAGEKGLTDFDLAGILSKDKNYACWRRVELVYLGYVKNSQQTRQAPSGKKVSVWIITKKGETKAQQLLKQKGKGT